MNCLEFRRRIGAEPRSRAPELLAHRDSCKDGCAAFWQRAQRFDDDLEAALAIPLPEGLVDRILLAQATVNAAGRSAGAACGWPWPPRSSSPLPVSA